MFVFDPLTQGLEFLAQRDLQRAENLFLRVINDPYVQTEELNQARNYLDDIRSCQSGVKELDFDQYKKLSKKNSVSLEKVFDLLTEIYFSKCVSFAEIDQEISRLTPSVFSRLKQIKIRDILARDALFKKLEKNGLQHLKKELADKSENSTIDIYRWKTIFRKFVEKINPLLLERHLELLEYVLETNNIKILEDSKLTVLTPKYRWIIESTINSKWFLLRSYFFKAKSEIQNQFNKKDGTRKYWEEVKFKKIKIFENCGFSEKHIQKFLFTDKLNYKTLEEIYEFSKEMGLTLAPRDVSLALRGVEKAKDHIRERAGFLMGSRKEFQDQLIRLGFSKQNSYTIARLAKKATSFQIAESFQKCLDIARDEIYWYRIPPQLEALRIEIENQCCKHLSTVRIHLFDRGRLNKTLLQIGKEFIRRYLIKLYGENVVNLHCYFRLETIHQYYKLKYFQHHQESFPSVSELIKISREEFQPILKEAYQHFIKKRRLTIPDELLNEIDNYRSLTQWEDGFTTMEEKMLLRFWFLMDHNVSITQGLIQKGVLRPETDLWKFVKPQEIECNI